MVDRFHSFYPRLHFYLLTKLQPAPINTIYLIDERIHRVSFPEPQTVTLPSMKNGTKTCFDIMRQSLVLNVQPSYIPVRMMTRNLLPTSCQNQYLKRVRQAELKLCCSRYHSEGRCYRATMETIFDRNNLICNCRLVHYRQIVLSLI